MTLKLSMLCFYHTQIGYRWYNGKTVGFPWRIPLPRGSLCRAHVRCPMLRLDDTPALFVEYGAGAVGAATQLRATTIQTAPGISTPRAVICIDNAFRTAASTRPLHSGCSRSAAPSGPMRNVSASVSSRSPPPIRVSKASVDTELNPAEARIARTRSGSAKAKGPGAAGSDGVVGSDGAAGGSNGSAAWNGICIHGLSCNGRQQTKTMRPPRFKQRRMLTKAATGSLKNITP